LTDAGERYRLTLPAESRDAPLDLSSLFGASCTRYGLEIGFGMGEHLLARAVTERDTGFLGVEPFRNGVARLISGLQDAGADNVRIWNNDVHLLLHRLPEGVFSAIYVLFPDPWPKRRHWPRRLIQLMTLVRLRDLLRPGGKLVLASDDPGYQAWMLHVLQHCQGLVWTAESPADWQALSDYDGKTGYQRRAEAAGRQPIFLSCMRADSA
jgi:tRNA (guanine-N7-)-methyltransferase